MGPGGSSCLDWVDASDGVREWVSTGRSGDEGNTVRVLGLRRGTRRKVDVLRGDNGGAVDDGPATGCEDEEAPCEAVDGGSAGDRASDGEGDGDGLSSVPFTESAGGCPVDMVSTDAGDGWIAAMGAGAATEGAGGGICEFPLAGREDACEVLTGNVKMVESERSFPLVGKVSNMDAGRGMAARSTGDVPRRMGASALVKLSARW